MQDGHALSRTSIQAKSRSRSMCICRLLTGFFHPGILRNRNRSFPAIWNSPFPIPRNKSTTRVEWTVGKGLRKYSGRSGTPHTACMCNFSCGTTRYVTDGFKISMSRRSWLITSIRAAGKKLIDIGETQAYLMGTNVSSKAAGRRRSN